MVCLYKCCNEYNSQLCIWLLKVVLSQSYMFELLFCKLEVASHQHHLLNFLWNEIWFEWTQKSWTNIQNRFLSMLFTFLNGFRSSLLQSLIEMKTSRRYYVSYLDGKFNSCESVEMIVVITKRCCQDTFYMCPTLSTQTRHERWSKFIC